MLKNLLHFWRGKDFLSQVLEEFKHMLSEAREMFNSVCKKLIYNEEMPGLKYRIYSVDEKINELKKDIRKRIVEHLSLQPAVDLPASLLLMSVVKDAERLGDYCKNLFEVTELLGQPLDKDVYLNLFNNVDQEVLQLFAQTQEAFGQSDEKKAILSWDYERKIAKNCDAIIKQLAQSNYPVNQAVCCTLLARYFKRLAAHLANISTSVILPISDLDYFDEKRRKDI